MCINASNLTLLDCSTLHMHNRIHSADLGRASSPLLNCRIRTSQPKKQPLSPTTCAKLAWMVDLVYVAILKLKWLAHKNSLVDLRWGEGDCPIPPPRAPETPKSYLRAQHGNNPKGNWPHYSMQLHDTTMIGACSKVKNPLSASTYLPEGQLKVSHPPSEHSKREK